MQRMWGVVAGGLLFAAAACGPADGGSGAGAADPGSTPAAPSYAFGWKTDFSKHAVPLNEITSGGVPRDGIPPLDNPKFVTPGDASAWLRDREPVVAFERGGQARAYPLQVLIWHEIVNDVVDGVPVAVTFCPLCNTSIAFDRRLDGTTYTFGTTGRLRNSDLVMWDRQTESWWQQITGEAIVGELTGKQLQMLPAAIVSWGDFRRAFPNGSVLSKETGHNRDYGENPYDGYDDINNSPFLFRGTKDGRLAAMERVVALQVGSESVAYPFSALERAQVVADRAGGRDLVVFWAPGTASALDKTRIADARDVGATGVFERAVNDRTLTFRAAGEGTFRDQETGSTWNVLGRATAGPMAGVVLKPVTHANHFWFAWAAFRPDTRVYRP